MTIAEWERVFKDIEDCLFPRLRLTPRQRALYYHLLRHTRLCGMERATFAVQPLAIALGISEDVRYDLRDLATKGCILVEERSRLGHLVRVLLPCEIEGVIVSAQGAESVDIEALDFFTDRRFVDKLLVREQGRCFYCLRSLGRETCQLDHVVPQVARIDNSYRNVVMRVTNATRKSRDARPMTSSEPFTGAAC